MINYLTKIERSCIVPIYKKRYNEKIEKCETIRMEEYHEKSRSNYGWKNSIRN